MSKRTHQQMTVINDGDPLYGQVRQLQEENARLFEQLKMANECLDNAKTCIIKLQQEKKDFCHMI